MMNLRFLYIVIIIILASCNSDKPVQKRNNEINKICVTLDKCLGSDRVTMIEIDSSLVYKLYRGGLTKKGEHEIEGFIKKSGFQGKVSQEFWDTLNILFEHINYKNLDLSKNQVYDGNPLDIAIHHNKVIKYFNTDLCAQLPDSVRTAFTWILNSYKTIPLVKADSIRFETKYLQ